MDCYPVGSADRSRCHPNLAFLACGSKDRDRTFRQSNAAYSVFACQSPGVIPTLIVSIEKQTCAGVRYASSGSGRLYRSITASPSSIRISIASFAEFIENDLQQFPLLGRRHLRDDDDETSVKRLLRIEPAKVRSIVGDEREIIADDAGHQVPIGLAAESEPVYVAGLMPARHRYRDERGMQTFINQQIHPAVSVPVGRGSRLSVVRLADFSLKPRSLSDFGRPRRGCAETHIVASASRRSSSLG